VSLTNGEVIKVIAEVVLPDETITQNVFHFKADFLDTLGDNTVATAVEAFVEGFYGYLEAWMDEECTFNPIAIDKVAWNAVKEIWETVYHIGDRTPTVNPNNASEQLPNQVAPVLVAKTERPKSNGRKFIQGFAETASSGSELVAGAITSLSNALGEYLSDIEASTNNYLIAGVPRSEANDFLPFASGIVNTIIGSQRRRKPGVGA
jgi:hypothetical protein